jgi:hypothetical protein
MLFDWLNDKNRNEINGKYGSGISIDFISIFIVQPIKKHRFVIATYAISIPIIK